MFDFVLCSKRARPFQGLLSVPVSGFLLPTVRAILPGSVPGPPVLIATSFISIAWPSATKIVILPACVRAPVLIVSASSCRLFSVLGKRLILLPYVRIPCRELPPLVIGHSSEFRQVRLLRLGANTLRTAPIPGHPTPFSILSLHYARCGFPARLNCSRKNSR